MPVIYNQLNKTPAAAITFVSGYSTENATINQTPIILKSQPFKSNCPELGIRSDGHWIVKQVTVSVTTDWSIDTAQIVLVPSNPNLNTLPQLPDVSNLRGGVKKSLEKDDEIRIYLGWISSGEEEITADLLGEIGFDPQWDSSVELLSQNNPFDASKKLSPVFWGFIDKLELFDRGSGPQLVLSCRDRMRVIADTRILAIPNSGANFSVDETTGAPLVISDQGVQGERENVIFKIISSVNAYGQSLENSSWRTFIKGLTARKFTYVDGERVNSNQISLADQVLTADALLDQSLWNRTAYFLPPETAYNPRVHIWSERPPLTGGAAGATLSVLNKTPLEVLDHLMIQELLPIDFKASPFNGDYVFGPRVIDFSGFEDPIRSNRTYFYKSNPPDSCISYNQQILEIEVLSTSFGSFNTFIVTDSNTNKRSSSFLSSIQLSVKVDSPTTEGRFISPPNRAQIIPDSTLGSTGAPPEADAALIALTAARRFSRDSEGIEIKVIGDPTFYLNEAFLVYNTVLHDYDTRVLVNNNQYNLTVDELKKKVFELGSQQSDELNIQNKEGSISVSDEINQVATESLSPNSGVNNGLQLSNKESGQYPIYRISNITHEFNEKSYTTTVLGVTDY